MKASREPGTEDRGPETRDHEPETADQEPGTAVVRVALPTHLRRLARVEREVEVEVRGPLTQRSVLDALEARYPTLCGTIRDQVTQKRRPFVRFFACEEDLSHAPPDEPLPDAVATGVEPFLIIGAMAGG